MSNELLNYDVQNPQCGHLCSCNRNKQIRPIGNKAMAQQTPKHVILDVK